MPAARALSLVKPSHARLDAERKLVLNMTAAALDAAEEAMVLRFLRGGAMRDRNNPDRGRYHTRTVLVSTARDLFDEFAHADRCVWCHT